MKPYSKLRYRVARLLGICGIVLGSVTVVQATIAVTSLDDSGPGSLRQAIADATPGDTIDFDVIGAITLTSGELVIDKDLNISGPGVTDLAVRTVGGIDPGRVFSIVTNSTVTLSGLTVTEGRIAGADVGAGILNHGDLTLTNCIVSSNILTSYFDGGGIYNDGVLLIANSVISENQAWRGGGIANYGALTIVCSTISANNTAGVSCIGGGIYNSLGTLTILDSTIASNSSGGGTGGAGIANENGTLNVINTAIFGNSGGYYGAGILSDSGFLTVSNSTISGNGLWYSSGFGGGIFSQSTGVIVSSTICSNYGGSAGGGIFKVSGSQLGIRNSIVAGNLGWPTPDCAGPLDSQDYNLIGNINGATITGVTTHNIYGKDPLLGPLADNGGPTMTHALLPGSPAIDHGSSSGLATDQRGQPRPFNFPAYFDADEGSDIGAYELQERAQTGPIFTVNSTNDVDDGVPGIAHCSLREAIAAANANADTNTIDFAVEVPGLHTGATGTITLTNGQLSITKSVNINGPGAANLTVSGNNSTRVFDISPVSATAVVISGLTIANGNAGEAEGGGIRNRWESMLTIADCTVTANRTTSYGGGIYNVLPSTLTIIRSMISSNAVTGWSGGGIFNQSGILKVINSTVFSNTAANLGGGILNGWNGALSLTNSTISGNSSIWGGRHCKF